VLRGPDHVFELTNAAYARFIGRRDVLGMPFRDALPEVAGQGYFELLDEVYRTGQTFTGRNMRLMLQRDPDLSLAETFIDFVYQPIRDADGAISGIFVEGFDVTDRVRAEMRLRELNETLEARITERTAELQDAVTQLQAEVAERERAQETLRQVQKMEAIGQLSGGIAHDFNNLLTVIMGGLERVQRSGPPDDERLQRAAEVAMLGARRAATLTQRLLAFSRRQPLDPQPTDVNRLVNETMALLRRTLGETIELAAVLSPRLWVVDVDRNQLENALLNLAVNARDAMPQGGKLTIETANALLDEAYVAVTPELKAGQYVAISVSDTGSGMPPEIVERVFEPFFTTKEPGRGTGLGLSQVYGFIKQSGGHVRIYSVPNQGTTVRLYLPRYHGELEADSASTKAVAPPRANGEVVLVVEDDDQVRAHTTEVLRELGYRVVEAGDANAALRANKAEPRIDLLFTDVVLPGKYSGRQLADLLLATRPGMKVLYTTGHARDAIVHRGRLDPGTALITKPFAMQALAEKVWTVLNG
jgi:signal transduction histidine kinase